MGRPHQDVVVVIAYDAEGRKVAEDIIPRHSFEFSGSLLLNSPYVRKRNGIRGISKRVFDAEGVRLEYQYFYFGPAGEPVEALHRRNDRTIIDP